jgi:hypothetical protein
MFRKITVQQVVGKGRVKLNVECVKHVKLLINNKIKIFKKFKTNRIADWSFNFGCANLLYTFYGYHPDSYARLNKHHEFIDLFRNYIRHNNLTTLVT